MKAGDGLISSGAADMLGASFSRIHPKDAMCLQKIGAHRPAQAACSQVDSVGRQRRVTNGNGKFIFLDMVESVDAAVTTITCWQADASEDDASTRRA